MNADREFMLGNQFPKFSNVMLGLLSSSDVIEECRSYYLCILGRQPPDFESAQI